jgi:hypothetical protein
MNQGWAGGCLPSSSHREARAGTKGERPSPHRAVAAASRRPHAGQPLAPHGVPAPGRCRRPPPPPRAIPAPGHRRHLTPFPHRATAIILSPASSSARRRHHGGGRGLGGWARAGFRRASFLSHCGIGWTGIFWVEASGHTGHTMQVARGYASNQWTPLMDASGWMPPRWLAVLDQ